jgi:hypothetical protein
VDHWVGPTSSQVLPCWGPPVLTWTNKKSDTWHMSADLAHPRTTTWHPLSLSSLIPNVLASDPQFAPRLALVPNLYPEKYLFFPSLNYYNSSICPKIMKFLTKISKFMMITSIIFNFNFALVSLYKKFICHKTLFLFYIWFQNFNVGVQCLCQKYYLLILSLIKHSCDYFDASSGPILFDQGLITCQPLESNISLIKCYSY